MVSLVVEPARMKETITRMEEHGLGKLMSQRCMLVCGLPHTSCLSEHFCSGQVSCGQVVLRALAGTYQLMWGIPV